MRRVLPPIDILERYTRRKPELGPFPDWEDDFSVLVWAQGVDTEDWMKLRRACNAVVRGRKAKKERMANKTLGELSLEDWISSTAVPSGIKIFLSIYRASNPSASPLEAIADALQLQEA